jgi:hypothetical protein
MAQLITQQSGVLQNDLIVFYKKSILDDADHEDFYFDDLRSNIINFKRVLLAST